MLVRPAAEADVLEQARNLGGDNLDAALRFLDAAETAFGQLARRPGLGKARRLRSPHLRGLRSWPVPGFRAILIFYVPVEGGVDVLRVLHGARDLPRILGE